MSAEGFAGFTMLGAPDAVACEGDACLVPGVAAAVEPSPVTAVIELLDDHQV